MSLITGRNGGLGVKGGWGDGGTGESRERERGLSGQENIKKYWSTFVSRYHPSE